MAAPVYESTGAWSQTAGANPAAQINVSVPSGVAADDIVEIHLFIDTASATVTPPAGFTEAPHSPASISGAGEQRHTILWKRATGADAGNYTVGFSPNCFAEGAAVRFSGCVTTGSPYDVDTSATDPVGSSGVTPAVSLTTLGPDRLIVHSVTNWTGGSWTPNAGYTNRATGGFNLIQVFTAAQAAQGSTGTVQATCAATDKSTAWLAALAPPGGGGETNYAGPYRGPAPGRVSPTGVQRGQPAGPAKPAPAALVGAAVEVDAAQPVAGAKTRSVGVASETDTAQTVARVKGRAVGVAGETDTAQPVGRAKAATLGVAAETDAAVSVAGLHPVGTADETDAAPAVGRAKSTAVGAATETDAALAISHAGPSGIVGRTATLAENASTQSITGTLPADREAGDYVVAHFGMSCTVGTFTGPGAPWTELVAPIADGGGNTMAAYGAFDPASAPTATTTAAAGRATCIMQAYGGVDPTTPVDVAADTAQAANLPVTAPTRTTVTDGARLLCGVVANYSIGSFTEPAGMTLLEQHTSGTGRGAALADEPFPTAGATGGRQWTSTSTQAAVAYLMALRPASAGQSAAVGVAAETDAAQALGRAKAQTVGAAAETDSAQALGRAKAGTVGVASETESALPVGGATVGPQIVAGPWTQITPGWVSPTGQLAPQPFGSFAIANITTAALGIAGEIDSAQPAGKAKTRAAGVAAETDTAPPLARAKTRTLGIAAEIDSAQPAGRTETRSVGVAAETDSGVAVGKAKARTVGVAAEVDTAVAAARAKARTLGVAAETDSAVGVGHGNTRPAGTATETDTAPAVGRAKQRALGVAGETEAALAVARGLAQTIGIAAETDTAVAVGRAKRRLIGTSSTTDTVGAVGAPGRAAVAGETDAAQPVGRIKARTVGVATTVDAAVAIGGRGKARTLGIAAETDTTVSVTSPAVVGTFGTRVLGRGRAMAERQMVDACSIKRPSGESTTGGVVTVTYSTTYTGKCRVQVRNEQGQGSNVGEAYLVVERLEVQLPIAVEDVVEGDRITILASAFDPALVGRVFQVRDVLTKTHLTSRRVTVTEVTS